MKRKALIAAGLLIFIPTIGCSYLQDFDYARGARMTAGDPHAGREKLRKHSCTSCHVIPGIADADGHAGPALDRWGRRDIFLKDVPNTSENLIRWVRRPADMKPGTPMPDMGLNEADARDIAAYLFSINK